MNRRKTITSLATEDATNEIIVSLINIRPSTDLGHSIQRATYIPESTVELGYEDEIEDLFPEYRKMTRRPFYYHVVEDAIIEIEPQGYLRKMDDDLKKSPSTQELRPENSAILRLLDKWFKEPPLGDDKLWEEFDVTTRKIRSKDWE